MAFQHAIVLTGGIATGKSTSAKLLSQLGFSIIDADQIAHQILDEQHDTIAKMFGHAFVTDRQVNRKALGMLIFSDPTKRKALEELLHPLIYQRIKEQSHQADQNQRPYLIDIPLFFETKRYPIKESIVVYSTPQQQLQRLITRDKLSPHEAQKRIDAQMSIDTKRELATYIIDNRFDLQTLQAECAKIAQRIT